MSYNHSGESVRWQWVRVYRCWQCVLAAFLRLFISLLLCCIFFYSFVLSWFFSLSILDFANPLRLIYLIVCHFEIVFLHCSGHTVYTSFESIKKTRESDNENFFKASSTKMDTSAMFGLMLHNEKEKIDWLARPFVMFKHKWKKNTLTHTHTGDSLAASFQTVKIKHCAVCTRHDTPIASDGIVQSGADAIVMDMFTFRNVRENWSGNYFMAKRIELARQTNKRTKEEKKTDEIQVKFAKWEWLCCMHARTPVMDICRYVVSVTRSQCICQDDKLNVSLEFVQ